MKNIKKLSIILTIILIVLLLNTVNVSGFSGLSQISNPTGVSSLTSASGKILGVIYTVAVAISLGMMFIIGIKYITSSVDQKASLKSRAIPYLIGAILVFGTANILKFIQKMSGWIK